MKSIVSILVVGGLGVKAWTCQSPTVPSEYQAACCDIQVSQNSTGFVGKDCFTATPLEEDSTQFYCLIEDSYAGCCGKENKTTHTAPCVNVIEGWKRPELRF